MQRTIAGGGANTYFLVFNLYDHLHMIFEEASAHFVPNTCPAIPVESIHCLWVLVWPAYIKPLKTVDSRRKPLTDYITPATHYVKLSKTVDPHSMQLWTIAHLF